MGNETEGGIKDWGTSKRDADIVLKTGGRTSGPPSFRPSGSLGKLDANQNYGVETGKCSLRLSAHTRVLDFCEGAEPLGNGDGA